MNATIDPQHASDTRSVERRRLPRASLATELSLYSGSNFYAGFTEDISEGGVFVASYAMLPVGAQNVDVKPRRAANSGAMITSSGSTPSFARSPARSAARRSDDSQASSCSPSVMPLTVSASVSSNPARRRCSITSGTPPAWKTWTVG